MLEEAVAEAVPEEGGAVPEEAAAGVVPVEVSGAEEVAAEGGGLGVVDDSGKHEGVMARVVKRNQWSEHPLARRP